MASWKQYHDFTKHTAESLRRTRHVLEWENMPDPFRHYEGALLLDLPADPPPPEASIASDGSAFLSQLLFYSAAISASKLVPSTGYRYALRVNPSSGNLHPTEFHFVTQGLQNWPDGLYHYRPSSHMAEQRAIGPFQLVPGNAAPVTFLLTSIAWREAWKYRDRAFRYCLHDIGHAWQALALAAQAMGWRAYAVGEFADDSVLDTCRLHPDEWPMLLIQLNPPTTPAQVSTPTYISWSSGQANLLSAYQVPYPRINEIHAATKKLSVGYSHSRELSSPSGVRLPEPARITRRFGEIARKRRSALDFQGGARCIALAQLAALLEATVHPLGADFVTERYIDLYLYIHRVDDLAPGVYRYWPESMKLELIRRGDQRASATALSLGQDLAGNSCVTFSMIADLDNVTARYGDRGYRYAFFEAGAIGHRLYLAAEGLGLGATGIGAFFDDDVHRYLGLTDGQVVYHFAAGYPIPDPRLVAG